MSLLQYALGIFNCFVFLYNLIDPFKPDINIPDKPKTIEAQDRSPITLTIGDNVTALTNTSITIQCPTSGVPTPTVTWTKDGQEIPSGGRYTVQDDGSLVISEADEEDSARYTCTAESVAGKDSVSSTIKIVGTLVRLCKSWIRHILEKDTSSTPDKGQGLK